MGANPIQGRRQVLPADAEAEGPLYFPSGNHRLFGWLHRPGGKPSTSLGVIVCKPFGFESVASYLSVRTFAETIASLGIPSMRFDYAGTGDSEDLDPRADQVDVWTRDIVAAADELRRQTGVERVCLLGFRLGALLATLAAPRCGAGTALVAVAPIASGRKYVRELRNFERAAAQFGAPPAAAGAAGSKAGTDGSMEVSGFLLSAATLASLSEVDLASAPASSVSDMLIIDRADLPVARPWCDKFSEAGVRTRYQALSGFIEMMMRPPDLTVTPLEMLAATRDWIRELAGVPAAAVPEPVVRPVQSGPGSFSTLLPSPGLGVTGPVEHPVFFGAERQLFGIVTEPSKDEVRRRGVILLNSGADYHIGPRRMHVSLARRWAQRGYSVLRMDLPGLGDSAKGSGRSGNEIFPPGAVEGIRAAVDLMRTEYGVRDLTVGGMCSGAFHSLQAAMEGLPVNRVLMVNPLNFFWEDGAQTTAVQSWEVAHKPAAYRAQVLSPQAWRRVLSGDVNLWRVTKIFLHRPWFALQSRMQDLARRLNIQLGRDLARELDKIDSRGVRIVFVFSQGDAGLNLLQAQSGQSVETLSKRYRVRIIDGADHAFTRIGPRSALEHVLSEELFASPGPAAPAVDGGASALPSG
jgi:alpha-beta hydrolase superfamily lysophospholipase